MLNIEAVNFDDVEAIEEAFAPEEAVAAEVDITSS